MIIISDRRLGRDVITISQPIFTFAFLNMDIRLSVELDNLYREIEGEIGLHGVECNGCGACCNFEEFDHVLYASVLEVAYIASNVDARLEDLPDGRCPFHLGGKCTIRKYRTVGCRVFYCDGVFNRTTGVDMYEKYHKKIKALTMKYKMEWGYMPFLGQLKNELKNEKYRASVVVPVSDFF